jgi:hypothetical protein
LSSRKTKINRWQRQETALLRWERSATAVAQRTGILQKHNSLGNACTFGLLDSTLCLFFFPTAAKKVARQSKTSEGENTTSAQFAARKGTPKRITQCCKPQGRNGKFNMAQKRQGQQRGRDQTRT